MSAKFLDALGDEGSDLRRQIGCMTGILQMFDRQHVVSGRRRSLPNQNRLFPGSKTNEPNGCPPRVVLVKTQILNENQRLSMDSSRNSFSSSSCSSSFSSLECNKSMLQENTSCEPSTYTDLPLKDSQMSRLHYDEKANNIVPSSSSQSTVKICRQPTDFRDIVKDSIHRESQGLSIKGSEKHKHPVRFVDSPRPQPVDEASVSNPRQKSRYLSEHEENPRSSSTLTKDNYLFSAHLSYDERDNPRTSLDSLASTNAASRLRDLPRLSLDSRELSTRNLDFCSKANAVLKELGRSNSHGGLPRTTDINQDFREQKPHSVVAKLMGLEAMPSVSHPSPNIGEGLDTPEGQMKNHFSLDPSKLVGEGKQDRIASPRSTVKVTIIPNRTILQSKIPTEPAPWRQPVKGNASPKGMPGSLRTHVKQNHGSVYGEIQRKLKDMEFQPSNKDLRALKQILDAINAKGLLEVKKEEAEHTSNLSSNYMDSCGYLTPGNAKYCRDIHPIQTSCTNTSTERSWDSPIVIMKPASSINVVHPSMNSSGLVVLPKVRISDATDRQDVSVNDQSEGEPAPRNLLIEGIGHNLVLENKFTSKNDESVSKSPSKTSNVASRHQKLPSESRRGLMRNSDSWSPRMQQKKLPVDKKVCTSSSLSPGKLQKPSRQSSESVSPRSKLKPKQKSEKMVSNVIREARNSTSQGDETSQRLNGSIPLVSEVDMEPRRSIQSAEQVLSFFHDKQSMSKKVANCATSTVRKKKDRCMRESSISAKGAATTSEQPSPVSVLDALLDKEDLSDSPVKDILFPSKDVCPIREINRRKHIENLVQKLEQLSSADIQETQGNPIASLCETQNPNHHYVSEILLASGLLLKNLDASVTAFPPIQLHHSGYPMNPELFLVLEQKKYGNLVKREPISQDVHEPNDDLGRVKRRLMFDTINEILVRKLDLDSTCMQPVPWLQTTQLSKRLPSGQQLLKELCVEIESLETRGPWYRASENDNGDSMRSILSRDMMQQSRLWTDLGREICGLVLDIERTIFKDLIDEVVSGGIAAAQAKPGPRRRKLFV